MLLLLLLFGLLLSTTWTLISMEQRTKNDEQIDAGVDAKQKKQKHDEHGQKKQEHNNNWTNGQR